MYFIDNRIISKEPISILRNSILFIMAIWISYNLITIYILKKEKQESGIVYKTAAKCKSVALNFLTYIKPFQKEFIQWTLIAAGMAFFGMLLVGLPGALLLAIPAKLGLVAEIKGDAAWPSAILVSLLWPFLFPIAVLVKYELIKAGQIPYALTGFIGTIVLGIILIVTLTYLIIGKTKN